MLPSAHSMRLMMTIIVAFALCAADEPTPKKPLPADPVKLPPGSVLVICKEVKDALSLIPGGVVLSPENYQSLIQRIEELERHAREALTVAPTSCRLSGQTDGTVCRFQAQFEFVTDRPASVVTLGCRRAFLKPGPQIDGKLPLLIHGDDGVLRVQVAQPGVHKLTLDLEVPLASRGNRDQEHGFDFSLPGSAITILDQFTFARPVREVRLNGRALRLKSTDSEPTRLEGITLGPVQRLEMTWRKPDAVVHEPVAQEADARIAVRMQETTIVTDVQMTLRPIGGEVRQWQIALPADTSVEIRERRTADERIDGIDVPNAASRMLTVRFKEPISEPYKLAFLMRQPRRGVIAVGPITVPGATRMRGAIAIIAPTSARLRFQPRADVVRGELTEESRRENAVAEFILGQLPATNETGHSSPFLEIHVEEAKGAVEGRVDHMLSLTEGTWRDKVTVHVTPVRTHIGQLEIEFPSTFEYDETAGAAPIEIIDRVDLRNDASGARIAEVKLAKDLSQPFSITFHCVHRPTEQQTTTVTLPRPLKLLDRGGVVAVTVPDGVQLRVPGSGPVEGVSDALESSATVHTWRTERFPTRFTLAWGPNRPEMTAQTLANVSISQRSVSVKQTFRLQFAGPAPRLLTLTVPAAVADRVRIAAGGTFKTIGLVNLASSVGREHTLEIEYSFPLPASSDTAANVASLSRRVAIPLVSIPTGMPSDAKVRIWTEPDTTPTLEAGSAWDDMSIESAPDHDSLPALVAKCMRDTQPLVLVLEKTTSAPTALFVESALLLVNVTEPGLTNYRALFLVRPFNQSTIDLELPTSPRAIEPEVWLEGRRVTRFRSVSGSDGNTECVLRIELPTEMSKKAVQVEVRYGLPADSGMFWRTRLLPPTLRSSVFINPVQWQINVAPGRLAALLGSMTVAEWRWALQGGLLVPRPSSVEDGLPSSIAGWQLGLAPVDLAALPRLGWFIVCSMTLLTIGLFLSLARLSATTRWIGLLIFGALVLLALVSQPDIVRAAVFGCEPGAIALIAILGARRLAQWNHRRRVESLPGFQRLQREVSMNGIGVWRPSEPSTIDSPNANVSSPHARSR